MMKRPVVRFTTRGGRFLGGDGRASSASSAPAGDPSAAWGPPLWAALHRRPWECPDPAGDAGWLAAFAAAIPCPHCRRHWRELAAAAPPDLSGRAAYFAWTWRQHNAVNASLGRPEFPFEEAARRYPPPGGPDVA
jgi:hypothetical protein